MTLGDNLPYRLRIGVCIDDFGLHRGVNEAALALANEGRVTALSCMTDGPAWREAAHALQHGLRARVDLGLHLNFTESWSNSRSRRSLPALIAAAYGGMLDPAVVRDDLRAQFDAFEDVTGAPPDFIDGHHHVHQLPVIRDALVVEIAERYQRHRPWLRNTAPPAGQTGRGFGGHDMLKHRLIAALGSRRLQRLAGRIGCAQNGHLLGVYGLTGSPQDYEARLLRWCDQASDNDLLMCHPAAHVAGSDAIASARMAEYAVLRSSGFADILCERRISVVRLSGSLTC